MIILNDHLLIALEKTFLPGRDNERGFFASSCWPLDEVQAKECKTDSEDPEFKQQLYLNIKDCVEYLLLMLVTDLGISSLF